MEEILRKILHELQWINRHVGEIEIRLKCLDDEKPSIGVSKTFMPLSALVDETGAVRETIGLDE